MLKPITPETAMVYRGGGRRWLTAKAAANAEAGRYWRLRHPCECDEPDGMHDGMGYPGYTCENHGERRKKFVRRVARLLTPTKARP